MLLTRRRALACLFLCATLGAAASPAPAGTRADSQYTQLISRNAAGGVPNGPSGNSVISNDKRYARVVAFESDASDLVAGDTNGFRDVFAVLRAGQFGNEGSPWTPGQTVLVSRTQSGAPANGPSSSPSVDGAFQNAETTVPSCIAFLSAASNIVPGDVNGTVDAFVTGITTGTPKRISPDVGADTTAVAVSGDCSLIAMVTGDQLYLYDGRVTRLIATTGGAPSDPSFGVGRNQDLVYATPSGAWLLTEGAKSPQLVAPGGSNPAYNDVKRQVVAYEKSAGGFPQVFFRDLGKPEHLASGLHGAFGDGGSRKPMVGNSGYSIAFESDAGNLGVNALGRAGDSNGMPDVYLYTDVRKLTLVQSVEQKAVPLPGGGRNPGMSFYNNYVTFDSAAPLGASDGPTQVFMRYLGGESEGSASGVDNLPTPEVGKTANVGVVSGKVFIKLPAGTNAGKYGLAAARPNGFTRLKDAKQVPLGSSLDTTAGRVEVQTAVSTSSPGLRQTGEFYQGSFQLLQIGGKQRPITQMTLNGELKCGRSARAKLEPAARRSRQLWGSGKGRFRTRGRNSSATVRGTEWFTKDTCSTTTTRVRSGTVVVRDFGKRRNIIVRAGRSYVARAK